MTVYFWIIKVLTTGMGETTSDYFVHRLVPTLAVTLAGICLAASLALQFSARRYVTWIYWLTGLRPSPTSGVRAGVDA